MRAATALAAACGSAKVLVLLWPAVPMRPQRVVRLLPSWEISQNLLEVPATNSKQRGFADAAPRGGNTVFEGVAGASGFFSVDIGRVWDALTAPSNRTPT